MENRFQMMMSKSKVIKICGKEYGSDRPMKRAINLYLQGCIEKLLFSPEIHRDNLWALVLDTEELLTTDALIASGLFERKRIVIPNPSLEETAGIEYCCPGVSAHQCTTHQLCADDCSLLRKIIGSDSALGVVFLDYNGRCEAAYEALFGSSNWRTATPSNCNHWQILKLTI